MGIQLLEVPDPSPYCLVGRVVGLENVDESRQDENIKIYIISVYVPGAGYGESRKTALNDIARLIDKCMGGISGKNGVIVMGDWNMSPVKLDKWLKKTGLGATLAKVPEKTTTLVRNGRGISCLDHIVYVNLVQPERIWVDKWWDVSDHSLVFSSWKTIGEMSLPEHKSQPRIEARRLLTHKEQIVNDARWLTLVDSEKSEDLETTANKFQETTWKVCTEHHAIVDPSCNRGVDISKPTKRAMWKRRKAYQVARTNPNQDNLKNYESAKNECELLLNAERKARIINYRSEYGEAIRNADLKTAWKWIKTRQRGTKHKPVAAIRNPDTGNLVTCPDQVAQIWTNWFGKLAEDSTGHSRDPEYWQNKTVDWKEEIPELNQELTWSEICEVLKANANGKAGGIDGIPMEFLKLAENKSSSPDSPLGKAMWHLLYKCWEDERFPITWNKAIVVPVPKKGDPTYADNYRGISLIASAQKIISGIIARRLMKYVVASGRLNKAQSGFRHKEEAVAQAVCLYEILSRRKIM